MKNGFEIIRLRDQEELKEKAANWFHEKWKIPKQAYLESMEECLALQDKIPQWYLVVKEEQIVAGLGVIANDFHKRIDLTPNICAVYVEKEYRKLGIAKELLQYACKDLSTLGYDELYLITDHTNFYEKCGWEFLGMVEENDGGMTRMYHTLLK